MRIRMGMNRNEHASQLHGWRKKQLARRQDKRQHMYFYFAFTHLGDDISYYYLKIYYTPIFGLLFMAF